MIVLIKYCVLGILHEYFQMKKLPARWMLQSKFAIVPIDETWVYCYTTKPKEQVAKEESATKTTKTINELWPLCTGFSQYHIHRLPGKR